MTTGNMKLPKSTLNFSLPPVTTCPGSTAKCRKYCYARKAFRQYPSVRTAWNRNFEETKKDSFVETISTQIKNSRTVETVRIHASGDFYTEAYFRKWLDIAASFPALTFYAYTKVTTVGAIKRPANFILLLSDDDNNYQSIWDQFTGVATVTLHGDQPEPNFFVCPGKCGACKACYNKTKNKRITFLEH